MNALEHAEWLAALLALGGVSALALLISAWRAGGRRRALLGAGPRFAGVGRDLALFTALAAIGVALLGPRIGQRMERVDVSGVDLVFLLDVSRSMDARDVVPSRLDRARRNAESVISALEPGDRVALAAFAGRGVLLTPLTVDHAALLDMLPSIDGELMRFRGSDLSGGVRASLGAYDAASLRPRVMLVLSDGEDPSKDSNPGEAAAEAARASVRVLTVALGSEAGSDVPDHGAPLRSATGEIVKSRRDVARLATLARLTGGSAIATDGFGAVEAASVVREIRRDATSASRETAERRVAAVRTAPFAALAFALLAAELTAPFALPLPALRRRRALAATATLLGLWLLAPQPSARAAPDARAADEVTASEAAAIRAPRDPVILLRLGVARARAGLGPEAERAFLASALYARDPALASAAYFNLGVTALERNELETARDAFFDALALAPRDDEARFNLEWTLHALRESVPPPAASPSAAPEPRPGNGADASGLGSGAPSDDEAGGDDDGTSAGAKSGEKAANGDAASRAAGGAEAAQASDRADASSGAEAPALDPADVKRWLETVQDDPGRALRDTARQAGGAERAPTQAPAW